MQDTLNTLRLIDNLKSFLDQKIRIGLVSCLLERGYRPNFPGSPWYNIPYIGKEYTFEIDTEVLLRTSNPRKFDVENCFSVGGRNIYFNIECSILEDRIVYNYSHFIFIENLDQIQASFVEEEYNNIVRYLEKNL